MFWNFPILIFAQITLKGPVMTQVQKGEKTNHGRGDLDTEVIRTFDKEVSVTDFHFLLI